ncbi:hypothetical protein [Poseidonocella sedimentorum]|uniref:Lipoprotein n=1 Tax=Poseidonocella sedimentorum TaxID=871652 RepID=A0A1I6DPY1_9RHOB|nr:hypothetical protein [Poseidonocella sedimentorum]SFR07520.1 hypothetical protein SAMN04515673_104242 [Poseidonocella sedimentorum]
MKTARLLSAAVTLGLAGCGIEGTTSYFGPDSLIARADDAGDGTGAIPDGAAALAILPDGCQIWLIDNGVEGYATPRLSRSGRQICNDRYPPGAVLGRYDWSNAGGEDGVFRRAAAR